MFENDYIMRMIGLSVKGAIKLIFGNSEREVEMVEIEDTQSQEKYDKWIGMANSGHINEAENNLYEDVDIDNKEDLKAALKFYNYINRFSTDFLDDADYERDEIKDGIRNVLDEYGYKGIADIY